MQWTMSNKLYEALGIRRIRSLCRGLPRWSAYLWSGMVKPRLCKVESVYESSIPQSTSKRQYGVEVEGNPKFTSVWVKCTGADTSGYLGYKSSASTEGAACVKMGDQIHKDSYPELGCSGDLNLTDTVHSVNVGTSCFGCERGGGR